jgi:hypothetical protein
MKKLSFILIAVMAAAAAAQDTPRLGLREYLAEVRANNPEIAAARALSAAYSQKVKQAWLPADPTLEFERMYAPGALGSGAAERNIMISQEFRNPYKSVLQRDAAKAEREVYSGLSGDKANKVLAEASAAFYYYALLWKT